MVKWSHEGVDAFVAACFESLDTKTVSREQMRQVGLSHRMLTIYKDGKPIGAAIFGQTAHIVVLKEYWGKWASKEFLRIFKEEMKKCEKTHVNPSNLKGIEFAERVGAIRTGMEKGYLVYENHQS